MDEHHEWVVPVSMGLLFAGIILIGRARASEAYDPVSQKWVPMIKCPSGMWWNPCNKLCENRFIDILPADCPDDQSWNRCSHTCETTPQCPAGTVWNPYIRLCQYPPIIV